MIQSCGGQSEYKQGGKQNMNGSEMRVSFPISFSKNCLSVITDLLCTGWDPGETCVWDVSRSGFNAGKQASNGYGLYWIATGT